MFLDVLGLTVPNVRSGTPSAVRLLEGNWMRTPIAILVLAVWLQAAPLQTGKPAKPAAQSSLTGCVDERDGQYVLTNDTDLRPTARLQPAAGSPEDNFAR